MARSWARTASSPRACGAARSLRERGAELEILDEDEFLSRLGLDEQRDGLRRLYTLTQLARILSVPVPRVRAWMRHGLIRPVREVRRLCFFDFAQVATAKRLAALTKGGVSAGRIRRSLEELRAWLPDAGRALTQLEALEGGPVLIRTDAGALAETSGQLRLDFPSATDERAKRRAGPSGPQDADEWFDLGVAAEDEGLIEEAVDAYRSSLAIDHGQPEVHFNIGNALYALGKLVDAERALRTAVEQEPDYVEAWNNLGVVASALGRTPEALSAMRRALALEPAYADAHYNLAETLAAAGDAGGAQRHWRAYLQLDPDSDWAAHVRERLTDR